MFDIAPSEFLLVAIVALVVIGPKDLPKAMRLLGYWVGKARGVARQFRSGFDNMVREAELADMEKKWASENERIMREHGAGTESDASPIDPLPDAPVAATDMPPDPHEPDLFEQPVTVERPHVEPATAASAPPAHTKAPS